MIALLIWPGNISFSFSFETQIKIFFSFRDILITPKRLSYASEKEKNLYESLIALTNSQQNDIQKLILQAVDEVNAMLIDETCSLNIPG